MLDLIKPYFELIAAVATILTFIGAVVLAAIRVRKPKPVVDANVVKWCTLVDARGDNKFDAKSFETRGLLMYHFDTTECEAPKNIYISFNQPVAALRSDSKTVVEYNSESGRSFEYKIDLAARHKARVSFFFDSWLIVKEQLTCAEVALVKIPYMDHLQPVA
jgi:hypothetical protein